MYEYTLISHAEATLSDLELQKGMWQKQFKESFSNKYIYWRFSQSYMERHESTKENNCEKVDT